MEPLKVYRRMFEVITFCSFGDKTNRWITLRNSSVSYIVLLVQLMSFITSITYFFNNIYLDLESSLYGLFIAAGFFTGFYTSLVAQLSSKQLSETFLKLQQFYDTYKGTDNLHFMEKADKRGQFIMDLFMKGLVIGCPLSQFFLGLISLFSCIIKYGTIIPNSLYVPHKYILPWDQDLFYGWIGEMTFSLTGAAAYCSLISSFLSFFITICLYHSAYYQIYATSVDKLRHISESKSLDKNLRLKECLCWGIRFHIDAKSVFQHTADLFSSFIFIQLVSNTIALACCVFQIELALKQLDSGIVLLLMGFTSTGSISFMYCYYGKLTTDSYLQFGDCIFNSNWTDLPNDLKKYIIMIISNAEKPLAYHGSGIAYLNLITYTNMMRTVISFYMMFKTLSE